MKNFEFCKYTYIHRKVIMELIKKYVKNDNVRKEMIRRAQLHDIDKLVSYLFYPKKVCSKLHRDNSSHHLGNDIEKNYFDYLEMIFDWESARYSKSDKPLNAYQTLYVHYKDYENEILPILKEYNLDSNYIEMDEEILKLANELNNKITLEFLLEDIQYYFKNIMKNDTN